ncbi:MAG: ABC-type transport auxiliary lipoprotein family protein [Candidatus Sabulitectum sp.]|nr:ABC-type transport auxiliary lipoprotein family protein [Candidatus Sabulitectum sp.]
MKKRIALSLAVLLMFTGCITVNVPLGGGDSAPAFQWQLKWNAPVQPGNLIYINALRIKDFDASGSYQLSGMVITNNDGTLSESLNNRWATRPGAMLSEMLSRDLQVSGNYPAIFRTAVSVSNVLTVEGYVREFGAAQVDSTTWIAVMDVDVTLMGDRGSEVLFQKNYRFEKMMPESGFKTLAEQMSLLGALWSEEVMADFAGVLLPRR